ncbi:unnamed protein product [Durusdinium trenchii]|uniref:Uncharacterized protein n=1 Tax=Durusdinium trenchii TaxID=1381693 RepID=A0ABP0M4Q1_9DINO
MTLAPWILWLIPFARADGPATSSTSASTTSSAVSNVEMVCSTCECPNNEWLGSQSLQSCADSCALKSSRFQHASGTRFDNDPGDNNCACCTALSTTSGDSGWGINVYESQSSPPYSPVCELCWCNQNWLGPRSISECATTCSGQGFSHFQHANGLKPDGTTGDYNCGCCSSSVTNSDPTWGVNVYSLELPTAAASTTVTYSCALFILGFANILV